MSKDREDFLQGALERLENDARKKLTAARRAAGATASDRPPPSSATSSVNLARASLLLTVALSALVLGCLGGLDPNLDLIRPYSYELQGKEPFDEPFLTHFKSGRHSLVYVAAHHETEVHSSTFRLIDRAFNSYDVRVVILEGFLASDGHSPASLIREYAASVNGDFYPWGEPSYAALKADGLGVPFIGGEPDDSEVLAIVQRAGVTATDLAAFYFVRQIPQFLRDGSYRLKEPAELYASFMPVVRWNLGLQADDLPFDEFLEWYEDVNEKRLDFEAFDSEEAAPLSNGKYRTQRISHEVGIARDRSVVRLIAESLEEYNRVLVVFGHSHLAQQRPALQAMLGSPLKQQRL